MELKKVFEERRAVNFFNASKPLPEGMLKEIVNLAVLAPSAFNLQPWRIIAATTPEGKAKLHEAAFKQPKIVDAPATLIIIGDREGYGPQNNVWDSLKAVMGEEAVNNSIGMAAGLYGSTPERKIKFAESNAGLLGMSIMYSAKEFGVDSHPMSGMDFQAVKDAFQLKDSEEVVMLISLGYRDESKDLYPRGMRKGYEDIVIEV